MPLQPLDKTVTKVLYPGQTILGSTGLETVRMVVLTTAYVECEGSHTLQVREMPAYGWTVVERSGVSSCYVQPVTVRTLAALPEPSLADICRNPLCPCSDDLALIGLDDNDWNESAESALICRCGLVLTLRPKGYVDDLGGVYTEDLYADASGCTVCDPPASSTNHAPF